MLFYFFLSVIIVALCLIGYKKKEKLIGFGVFSILTFVAAFRFDVGYDFVSYYELVRNKSELALEKLEPINWVIFKFACYINSPQLVFVIYSILTYTLIYLTIRRHQKYQLEALFIFFTFPLFFLTSLGIVRQFFALSIVLYSYRYILDRNIFKFAICIIIASLVHLSALIAIFLYILNRIRFTNLMLIALYILSFLGVGMVKVITSRWTLLYSIYFDQDEKMGSGGDKILLLQNLLLIILWIIYCKLKDKDRIVIFLFNAFFCSTIIYNLLSPFGHAGMRGSLYYSLFMIFLIPELIRYFKPNLPMKRFIYLGFFILFNYFIYLSTLNPDKAAYTPYKLSFTVQNKTFK